ncbi:hypothetical protein IEQ34_020144 [Dendrobium chrysotoxum]|uniref:Transposase n=1 Tax=Dendrobium chrysotoxum TaxID=161865 RepID=A0AAV7G1B0_DENCH|nr:hypothetical protein IEQ34_020144 [Dendrobium chrysotoxum]
MGFFAALVTGGLKTAAKTGYSKRIKPLLLVAEMTRGSLFRRAKKVICRGGSSRGGSSRDEQGNPIRRRGRTTCADIQNMPPGTRIYIEVNENNIPCNIPESILLGSYHGVVARDPTFAPIIFPDWRNKRMEPFKKKMLAEVESKFEFPGHIRHWILQSLGVKWRNYKTTLKAEHWDSRPIEEILETVPAGVDQTQWCQLVNQWSKPEDQTQTCKLLTEEGLTPEDDNIEANKRVFAIVMGPEHSGRVRTQGFGVTPTRFFPQSKTEGGSGSNFGQIASLREEFRSFQDNQKREFGLFRDEMRQFMVAMTIHPMPDSLLMSCRDLFTGEGSSSGSTQYSEHHTWLDVVGGRQRGRVYGLGSQGYAYKKSSSTSAFYDASGAEEIVSQRVAALTREIEEMINVQNEMQAELRSYRDDNQKKKQ